MKNICRKSRNQKIYITAYYFEKQCEHFSKILKMSFIKYIYIEGIYSKTPITDSTKQRAHFFRRYFLNLYVRVVKQSIHRLYIFVSESRHTRILDKLHSRELSAMQRFLLQMFFTFFFNKKNLLKGINVRRHFSHEDFDV